MSYFACNFLTLSNFQTCQTPSYFLHSFFTFSTQITSLLLVYAPSFHMLLDTYELPRSFLSIWLHSSCDCSLFVRVQNFTVSCICSLSETNSAERGTLRLVEIPPVGQLESRNSWTKSGRYSTLHSCKIETYGAMFLCLVFKDFQNLPQRRWISSWSGEYV
jgi:hypothetical protein